MNSGFEQIKRDYEEGIIGSLDAIYKIIKRRPELGRKADLYLIGDDLLAELKSYVDSFVPERRSFPTSPPTQEEVNAIKEWLDC